MREISSKEGKMSNGSGNPEKQENTSAGSWTGGGFMKEAQVQMGLEGGRVEGRSSYRGNLQVQRMGEVKVWVCSH